MSIDAKNNRMISCWSIEKKPISTYRFWLYENLKSLSWKRFNFWKNYLNLPQELKSIDVGCGYGKFSMALGMIGSNVTLLDYNDSVIKVALDAHQSIGLNPNILKFDILKLPLNMDGIFDIACSFGTLEHFSGKNRKLAFQANLRLLRPGGLLFFTVPNRYGIFYRFAFGMRRRLGLVPKNFFEQPFSIKELFDFAISSGVIIHEIEGISTLSHDFNYWIGENVKSLFRKFFGTTKKHTYSTNYFNFVTNNIDLLGNNIQDRRNSFDKKFSATLLFVGQKK